MTTLTKPSLGGVVDGLLGRVYNLEQQSKKIPDPLVLGTVTIGDLILDGTLIYGSPPAGITGYTATPGVYLSDVYVDLHWDIDPDATSYYIFLYLKDSLAVYHTPEIIHSNTNTIRINNLQGNQTYGVQIVAVNSLGQTSPTYPISGYADFTTIADTTIPAVPTGLTASTLLATSNLVNTITTGVLWWNENTEPDVARGVGVYEVQVDDTTTFTSPRLLDFRVSATVLSFSFTQMNTSVLPLYARISAIDSSGNQSGWSTTLSLGSTTGTGGGGGTSDGIPPGNLSAAACASSSGVRSFFAVWTPLTNADPTTYEVHVGTTSGFTVDLTPNSATRSGVSATIGVCEIMAVGEGTSRTALVAGTNYYFKVIGHDPDGYGTWTGVGFGPVQMGSGQIGTNDIAAGSVTAAKIAANTITASQIAANTITASQIATTGLNASAITVGTMSGDRITANTLDVGALKTSVLTATTITLGTGGTIRVGTPPSNGLTIDDTGITAWHTSLLTFHIDNTGQATFSGTVSAASILGGTISGSVITGGAILGGSGVFPNPADAVQYATTTHLDQYGLYQQFTDAATSHGFTDDFRINFAVNAFLSEIAKPADYTISATGQAFVGTNWKIDYGLIRNPTKFKQRSVNLYTPTSQSLKVWTTSPGNSKFEMIATNWHTTGAAANTLKAGLPAGNYVISCYVGLTGHTSLSSIIDTDLDHTALFDNDAFGIYNFDTGAGTRTTITTGIDGIITGVMSDVSYHTPKVKLIGSLTSTTAGVTTTRHNLCANPNFEASTASWVAIGSSVLSTSTLYHTSGAQSMKITIPASAAIGAAGAAYLITGLTTGQVYTVSVDTFAPPTPLEPLFKIKLTGGADGTQMDTFGETIRLSVTFTATSASQSISITNYQTAPSGSGQYINIDSVLIEHDSVANPYFDGSMANCSWDGTTNLSASTATVKTTNLYSFVSDENDGGDFYTQRYVRIFKKFTLATAIDGNTAHKLLISLPVPHNGNSPNATAFSYEGLQIEYDNGSGLPSTFMYTAAKEYYDNFMFDPINNNLLQLIEDHDENNISMLNYADVQVKSRLVVNELVVINELIEVQKTKAFDYKRNHWYNFGDPDLGTDLTAGWDSYNPVLFSPARFMIDDDGMVHCNGLVAGGIADYFSQLPPGLRPLPAGATGQVCFPGKANQGSCVIVFNNIGEIGISNFWGATGPNPGNAYVSLDNVHYWPEDIIKQNWQPIQLAPGWVAATPDHIPRWMVDRHGIVHLAGQAVAGTGADITGLSLFTLPQEAWPAVPPGTALDPIYMRFTRMEMQNFFPISVDISTGGWATFNPINVNGSAIKIDLHGITYPGAAAQEKIQFANIFQNSWGGAPSAQQSNMGYLKTDTGIVHWLGSTQGGAVGSTHVITDPMRREIRPSGPRVIVGWSNTFLADIRMDQIADGQIYVAQFPVITSPPAGPTAQGSNGQVCFDGVCYPAQDITS